MSDPAKDRSPCRRRYQSLDFWRGVACLMIVVFHSQAFLLAGIPDGARKSAKLLASQIGWSGVVLNKFMQQFNLGVPIFFVISGYCIAATCDSSLRKSSNLSPFYLRRFRRIFPPYWIYLGLVALLFGSLLLLGLPTTVLEVEGVSQKNPWKVGIWQFIGSVFLTGTWQDRLTGGGGLISGQAWSLCYEEQFYFISGLLLWLFPRRFYFGVAVVTGVALALFITAPIGGLDLHGFFFDGHWFLFAAGILVFYRLNYCPEHSRWVADLALLVLTAFLTLMAVSIKSKMHFSYFFPSGAIFALIICWLHPWDSAIATSPFLRPFAFCGRMCYSLYLMHYPITILVSNLCYRAGIRGFWPTVLATIPVATVLSIGISHLFAVLVERRFLNSPGPSAAPSTSLQVNPQHREGGLGTDELLQSPRPLNLPPARI